MNFIERQDMVRFKVFPVQCMMHEVLLKIHRMPDFFLKKKRKLWAKQVLLVIHLFSLLANHFLDSLSTGVEPKKSRAEVSFSSLGLTGLKQEKQSMC